MTDVCNRGAFIMQRDMEEFERNLAAYVGVKHVVGLANATDALHLMVRAAGIGRGDEVIFSSHTMVATAAAIHFAGATPVPAECGADHLIDAASVEKAITPAHEGDYADATQRADERHGCFAGRRGQARPRDSRRRRPGAGVEVQGALCGHVRRGRRDQFLSGQDAGLFRRRRLRDD